MADDEERLAADKKSGKMLDALEWAATQFTAPFYMTVEEVAFISTFNMESPSGVRVGPSADDACTDDACTRVVRVGPRERGAGTSAQD